MRTGICGVLLIAFTIVPASAQESWSVDDVLKQESASSFSISPDGNWVLWTKNRPDKESDAYVPDIYLSSPDGKAQQLTRGAFSDRSPLWSADGVHFAFISSRQKGKPSQIWYMHAFGGEPEQLTKLQNGVNAIAWQDGVHIIFSAREDSTLREQDFREKKDDTIIVGDQEHYPPVRLFRLDVKTKKIERLSVNQGQIIEFAVSPDGRWAVTNENQSVHYEYDHRAHPRQYLYNLKTLERRELFTAPHLYPYGYAWTLDSEGFYCARALASDSTDTYVSTSALYHYDLAADKLRKVDLDWQRQMESGYVVTADGVLVPLANGVRNRLAFYRRKGDGWQRSWLNDSRADNLSIRAIGKDGRTVVYSHSTASSLPRYFSGTIKGDTIAGEHELVTLNPYLKGKNIARSVVVSWKGARGDMVEGMLYYPHNYKEGAQYPLMTVIHGGPSGWDSDEFGEGWGSYPNILASRGAFVFTVNYHGSGNYGVEWVESIKGHYYEYEVVDILTGIDYLIGREFIDEDRLGIMGWSNGSILSIQCTLASDRFKVLGAGAGDVNWSSDYGNCAFGAGFDNAYFGGPPWELPQTYLEKSPLFQMQKANVPTIIFFGTEDTNVPTEQGWEHYRALQQIGKTPVRFLLFPGEPHGLRKLSHQRRKMEEELAWFDTYLFKTTEMPNEVIKKGSPLDIALKRSEIAKSEGLYGERHEGTLIPELVKMDSLAIGRFEVTRAQYARWKSDHAFAQGTENFPVNTISFAEAQGYCEWLSRLTGRSFRLPTETEMARLLEKAGDNFTHENNLDHWAGYTPTPDEVQLLSTAIGKLEAQALLIKEVGSMRPCGEGLVFDLGGNVAEWCRCADGSGKALGPSAVSTTDTRVPYQQPGGEYTGMRVAEDRVK